MCLALLQSEHTKEFLFTRGSFFFNLSTQQVGDRRGGAGSWPGNGRRQWGWDGLALTVAAPSHAIAPGSAGRSSLVVAVAALRPGTTAGRGSGAKQEGDREVSWASTARRRTPLEGGGRTGDG
jgi:hypothetical protein